MQTLKTILWVIFAAMVATFAVANWSIVTVAIWPGYSAELPLPLLVVGAFLLGFLPPFIGFAANRWQSRRLIEQQRRTISDLRTPATVPPASSETPTTSGETI